MEADGSRTTLADRYAGKRLNSPNDIVFLASGSAFFTDPPYGLEGPDKSENKEVQNSIYRLDPDGTVTLVAGGQTRPNGIGISPDEKTLYVANSDANRV
jgi:gluconolactonase